MLGRAYQRGYGVWIRDGVIVYTVWKDTKVVRVASTIHSGNSHNQVKRRFKTLTSVVEAWSLFLMLHMTIIRKWEELIFR